MRETPFTLLQLRLARKCRGCLAASGEEIALERGEEFAADRPSSAQISERARL
jgi:hypothetical protein